MGLIYLITNKVNDKRYVGQTCRLWPKRKKEHINSPDNSSIIDRAIQKYGSDNFIFEIIDETDNQKNLNLFEKFWIRRYKTFVSQHGYNIRDGGSNGNHSKETCQKISKSNKGKHHMHNRGQNNYLFGKKIPEDIRKKMSTAKQIKKYPGVRFHKNKNPETACWQPRIRFGGKQVSLGCYIDPISASLIYKLTHNEIYKGAEND